ncbi:type II toxin-antitoxin system HicA family toxin [uncultured Clostridium sp.]|jgi:predicted RNA binding protein YcfA (HicA-like mRNA interferase family)|uniref:type II toxin-antitoxin system HicA family toxin n=1 Tax=uncultured Clostridium sp. TaxID=59620 RepID=UPI00260CDDDE|nr:type II toxin-antitoxin system HicA family toxin [uncultured Clostridium sp.]
MKNKTNKTNKKIIPKDYKNINKYISSPNVKRYINEAIDLSDNCKKTIANLISEKFIDFMTPIENIIKDLFNDLSLEIMRRYQEIFSTKTHDIFQQNLSLVSSLEIHKLYNDLESEIISDGKIILENSNTLDDIYGIFNEYLINFDKIVLSAANLKILAVINHLEFIQLDSKNYINNLVQSVSKEAFDLYSEEMDRYFLDIQSFINTNNSILTEHLKSKLHHKNHENTIDNFFNWVKDTEEDLHKTKSKIFTHYKYQELNKIATDNGFILNRITGGHGIFINNSGLVTVIPQGRDIGKGLQIKILKSIGVRN